MHGLELITRINSENRPAHHPLRMHPRIVALRRSIRGSPPFLNGHDQLVGSSVSNFFNSHYMFAGRPSCLDVMWLIL